MRKYKYFITGKGVSKFVTSLAAKQRYCRMLDIKGVQYTVYDIRNKSKMTDKQRWYKIGKHLPDGSKFYKDSLKPMTHHQACTFISKMMQPAVWFVYEVDLNGEEPL